MHVLEKLVLQRVGQAGALRWAQDDAVVAREQQTKSAAQPIVRVDCADVDRACGSSGGGLIVDAHDPPRDSAPPPDADAG